MRGDRRQRIVVVAPHFAEYASRLAAALSVRSRVLLITEQRNLASECEGLKIAGDGSNLSRLSYNGRHAMDGAWPLRPLARRKVIKAIRAFRPDLLHVQEQGDTFTAAIVEIFAQTLPIVLTVHDPVPHSGNDALVAERFAAGLATLRSAAGAYHVHGAHCAALLRGRLATAKPIVATPHGVILVPGAGDRREPEDRLLFFGRMEAYKGLDVLLDAIDLLPAGSKTRLVLAGRGPELDGWRSRIAANPSIDVLDKFLTPREAIAQFQRARAVIAPYRDASQSGVLSAAYGNGRPVIASAVGGLVDSVRDGESGLLLPAGDPAALADAMAQLADAGLRARLTEGARTLAGTDFSWEAVTRPLDDLYASMV